MGPAVTDRPLDSHTLPERNVNNPTSLASHNPARDHQPPTTTTTQHPVTGSACACDTANLNATINKSYSNPSQRCLPVPVPVSSAAARCWSASRPTWTRGIISSGCLKRSRRGTSAPNLWGPSSAWRSTLPSYLRAHMGRLRRAATAMTFSVIRNLLARQGGLPIL